MAADLFGRNVGRLDGVFAADQARLNFFGMAIGVLVQQMSINYQQAVTRLYEVGSDSQYYIGGRTQGQITVNRVIGPSGGAKTFYQKFGNVCGSRGRSIMFKLTQTDCSTSAGTPTTFFANNTVITAVSVGVAAQDMIIGENTNLMFTSLEVN